MADGVQAAKAFGSIVSDSDSDSDGASDDEMSDNEGRDEDDEDDYNDDEEEETFSGGETCDAAEAVSAEFYGFHGRSAPDTDTS